MLQSAQQLAGPSPVEVQGGQRVAPPTRQHQEVASEREACPPQGVELRQRQREGPLTCRRKSRQLLVDTTLRNKLPLEGAAPESLTGTRSPPFFTVLMTAQSGSYPGSKFVSSSPPSPS